MLTVLIPAQVRSNKPTPNKVQGELEHSEALTRPVKLLQTGSFLTASFLTALQRTLNESRKRAGSAAELFELLTVTTW